MAPKRKCSNGMDRSTHDDRGTVGLSLTYTGAKPHPPNDSSVASSVHDILPARQAFFRHSLGSHSCAEERCPPNNSCPPHPFLNGQSMGKTTTELVEKKTSVSSEDHDSSPVGNPINLLSSRHMRQIPPGDEALCSLSIPGISEKLVNVLTYRRSELDFELYRGVIHQIVTAFLEFNAGSLHLFMNWVHLGSLQDAPKPAPPPAKLDIPKLYIGGLFSNEVYGNDAETPMYYFSIVKGQADPIKATVTSSKAEAAGAAFYEAVCGYSTVLVFAVRQSTRQLYMDTHSQLRHIQLKEVRSARDAVASIANESMIIKIVF